MTEEPDIIMIIPTDEQVERACALVAQGVNRAWPEDIATHELSVWRATCRSTLVMMLNRSAILDVLPNPPQPFWTDRFRAWFSRTFDPKHESWI